MKPPGIAAPDFAVKPSFVRRPQEPALVEHILASKERREIEVQYRQGLNGAGGCP